MQTVAMIDVWGVAANSLWVLGLAVVLAALSWANWAAKTAGTRLRHVLARPPIRRALDFGLALFCAGLAATADPWWQQALWAALSVAWIVQILWPTRSDGMVR